jgi:hypothetical protein
MSRRLFSPLYRQLLQKEGDCGERLDRQRPWDRRFAFGVAADFAPIDELLALRGLA